MTESHWREHRLQLPDHAMCWYDRGEGPPVVFLHGSYDQWLCREMAEPFCGRYRCILYDQRGTEDSPLAKLDEPALHVDRFIEDLDRLRESLGLESMCLFGHSWGAMLGLLYGSVHPSRVRCAVLAGMGPVSAEMKEVYRANVQRMIDQRDRIEWDEVDRAYRRALNEHTPLSGQIEAAHARLWSRVMCYSNASAARFARQYLESGGIARRAPNCTGLESDRLLNEAHRMTAPTLILYGSQDYEPIIQAYLLRDRMRQAEVTFINRCGHMLWLDQTERFYTIVDGFLSQFAFSDGGGIA